MTPEQKIRELLKVWVPCPEDEHDNGIYRGIKMALQQFEEEDQLRYFKEDDFACRCGCGKNEMDRGFLRLLDRSRHIAGVPFVITSGYRCIEHNATVSNIGTQSPHPKGFAADVVARNSSDRWEIMMGMAMAGIRRIGINFDKKFIHCDNDPSKPEGILFGY